MALKTACPSCGKEVRLDGAPTFTCPHCNTRQTNPVPLRRDPDETIELPAAPSGPFARPIPTLKGPPVRSEPSRDAGELLPRRLGNYELLEVLGRGGMGVVYRARHVGLDRLVALKLIRGLDPGTDDVVRFVAEAQVTGQIEHPNIVPVHEVGSDEDGRPYFVMKLVRGRSLSEVLVDLRRQDAGARDEYPLARLLAVFCEVCQAVAFAHSKGVLHRDLKPGNVMIGDFGEVQVMDWGLAKKFGEPETRTAGLVAHGPGTALKPVFTNSERVKTLLDAHPHSRPGIVAGTPEYMSPEQAAGEPAALSPRSDVYSLGAILYEILNYRPPHMDADTRLLMRKVATEQAEFPHRVGISKHLRAITMKALDMRPEERYGGALALLKDVRAFLEDQPVSAAPDSLLDQGRRLVRRHGALLATGTAALVLLSLGAALASWQLQAAAKREAILHKKAKAEEEGARRDADARAEAEKLLRERAQQAEQLTRDKLDAEAKQITQALDLQKAVPEYLEALDQLKRRQYEKAAAALERILEVQPFSRLKPLFLFTLGEAHERIGTPQSAEAAIANFLLAHENAPAGKQGDPRALFHCGETAWKLLGNPQRAREFYRRAYQTDPENPYGILGQAYSHVLAGQAEADADIRREHARNALALAQQVIEAGEALWEAHYLAGRIQAGLDLPAEELIRPREALDRLTDAVKLEPGKPELWLARAEVNLKLDQAEAAVSDYDAVLRLSPQSIPALRARAALHEQRKRPVDALRDLDSLELLTPDDLDVYLQKSRLLLATGSLLDAKAAEAALTLCLSKRTDHAKAFYLRARALFIQSRVKEAARDAILASRYDPENVDALRLKGDYCLKGNLFPEAWAAYSELRQKAPDDHAAILGLAETRRFQGGRNREAADLYREYLKQQPEDQKTRLQFIRYLLEDPDQLEGAVKAAQEADALAKGKDAQFKKALAEAYLANNEVQRADAVIQKAYDDFPTDQEIKALRERIDKKLKERRK